MAASRSLSAMGLLLAALVTLSACGGGSKGSAESTPQATVTASTAASAPTDSAATIATSTDSATTAASSTPASDSAGASPADTAACSNANVEVNKAINAIPEGDFVVDIEIEGACTVSVKTGYTQNNAASALKICQASETPAYANGATAISVVGNGGELAAGTKGSPCQLKG